MTVERSEVAGLVALASLPAIGPATLAQLHERASAAEAWEACRAGRGDLIPAIAAAAARQPGGRGLAELHAVAARLDAESYLQRHLDLGVEVLVHGEPGYPDRLLEDPAPPVVLFASGRLGGLAQPCVAIVGTRNATRLGCDTAAELAGDLHRCGVTIVSGLALGIDGAAHRAVVAELEANPGDPTRGRPVAVVAAGLDHRYPRRHAGLHQQVARLGAVLSEVPLGVAPTRWRFPARNRIIAGLADALVVVESRSAGGSMLTVGEALARDRPILAVPGHPTSPAAAGALDLICDGAIPLRDAGDVLVAIGLGGRAAGTREAPGDDPDEQVDDPCGRTILELLARGPASLADLVAQAGGSVAAISEALTSLEVRGRVVRTGAWFELRAPAAGGRRP